MIKKELRCLGREMPMLGMGAMRFPVNENLKTDRRECIDMLRHAIDSGIEYIDTGYTYHKGESERIIGEALKDGYREKVILADKMPVWLAETAEDIPRLYDEQRERLKLPYIDMYLVHNIMEDSWKRVKEWNVIEFIEDKKAKGEIRHIGFSFHGELPLFKEVVDSYPWDFCQIQLNYLDRNIQAGLAGLEYARNRGLDVIIMEPLKGGRITENIPDSVQEIWDNAKASGAIEEGRTPAKTAFKWVANQPGVTMILSGMSSIEQIDENIEIFSDENMLNMGPEESAAIDRAAEEYNRLYKYQCTGCEYCKPCEKEIDIPGIIDYLNSWYAFSNPGVKFEYRMWIPDGCFGSDCIGCGKCEGRCPQSLPIRDIMKEAVEVFGK